MSIIRAFFVSVLLIVLTASCKLEYKYWDISRFKFDSSVLSDNDEIKLLYTSRGPDNNKELQYYVHVIAISQRTGDTVNILTTVPNGFTMEDKDKIFNYFTQDNIVSKTLQPDLDNKVKKIDKVARDPNFDNIADNNYPTVIGIIGVFIAPGTN